MTELAAAAAGPAVETEAWAALGTTAVICGHGTRLDPARRAAQTEPDAIAGEAPPGGWLIRVTDDHRNAAGPDGQAITIRDGGLATSSPVARRWRHGARAVHHVLDPRTGQPVAPCWRTASVVARTCAEANIASTAALALGGAAPAWLHDRRLPARLVSVSGALHSHGGWPS